MYGRQQEYGRYCFPPKKTLAGLPFAFYKSTSIDNGSAIWFVKVFLSGHHFPAAESLDFIELLFIDNGQNTIP